MCGRREKRGWETEYPRGRELGEIGNKFCNIVQFFLIEKHTEVGTTKEGRGNREYKVREAENSDPPAPPPPPPPLATLHSTTRERSDVRRVLISFATITFVLKYVHL